jgi:hypothetical protein
MSLFDTRHKKKSFTLTTILLSALLLLLFYIGLTYLEPPIENGITVNFGALEFGSGEEQPKKKVKSQPVQRPPVPEEKRETEKVSEPEEKIESSSNEEKPSEKLLTRDDEESIKIKQQREAEKKAAEAAEKEKREAERLERERQAAEEKARQEKEAKKKELDALIGGVSQADGEVDGGEGDDQLAGDKGQPDGDPYATTYYGPGGGSGTGGYGLSGRTLASSGKVKQECNQQGRVVVKITVDQSGKVIKATAGVKGTNNNDPCLLEPARKTAFLHRWKPDSNAPGQQTGFVVVNFKLGE